MMFAGLKTWVAIAFVAFSTASTIHASTLRVTWNGSGNSDIAEYRLYIGTSSGQYPLSYSIGNGSSVNITNLVPGTLYHFAVSAVNNANLESPLSQPISAQMPPDGLALIGGLAAGGQYELRIQGPGATTYIVDESEDLRQWTPVAIRLFDGTGQATFRSSADRPKRFYRVRLQ